MFFKITIFHLHPQQKSVIEKLKERHGVVAQLPGASETSRVGSSFGRKSSTFRRQRSELFSGGLITPATFSLDGLEVAQPLTRYERSDNLGKNL